jgi:hypothetical protein
MMDLGDNASVREFAELIIKLNNENADYHVAYLHNRPWGLG